MNEFIEGELFPALYQSLDTILPEFDLQPRKSFWQSAKKNNLKTDGTEGSSGGSVYVYENNPGILKSFKASSPSRNLIAYLANREGMAWLETVAWLAEKANLQLSPNFEITADYKKSTAKNEIWTSIEEYFKFLLEEEKLVSSYFKRNPINCFTSRRNKFLTCERSVIDIDWLFSNLQQYL